MHELPEYFLLGEVLPAGYIPGHPELDVDDGTRLLIFDRINTMRTRIEEAEKEARSRRANPDPAAVVPEALHA